MGRSFAAPPLFHIRCRGGRRCGRRRERRSGRPAFRVHGVVCPFFCFFFFLSLSLSRDRGHGRPQRRQERDEAARGIGVHMPGFVPGAQVQLGGAQDDAGFTDIAGHRPEPGGMSAMLPGIAIAARSPAALAAMHPTAPVPVHRRRAARPARTGARAAAGRGGEDGGLHGRLRGCGGSRIA